MTNLCHNFFADFIIFSFLWYQFNALDEKQSLVTRLNIYEYKYILVVLPNQQNT